MALGADFRRLWIAYGISELGTAVSMGALPLIATVALHSSVLQVSLLSALAGLAAAALAVPLGPWIEFRRKRPVMIGADLLRFVALASVPVAAALGALTYAQLCLVAVAQAVGVIVFNAASGAHLKNLVDPAERGEASSRFEATLWTTYTAGPPLGGLLIGWLGATASMAVDAVSFLLSALGVRRIRSPEPPPPVRHPVPRWRELTAGWHYILNHRDLRALWLNSLVFGGCVMAGAPLLAVLMLRELGFAPWQYGFALGIPCAGGIVGALLVRPFRRRFGERPTLLTFGTMRTLFLGALAIAPAGPAGLAIITAGQVGILVASGAFNPTFAVYRMEATDDDHMSRVLAAWSISSRVAQPLMIAVGGALAALTSTRVALAVLAILVLASIPLLPWRRPQTPPGLGAAMSRTPAARSS